MITYKTSQGNIVIQSGYVGIHLSEYEKATIEYPVEKVVHKTTTEKKQDTVVDADGNTIVLREYDVEVPILDEKGNPIIKEKVREIVRYNPYDGEYVVIPDDAKVITEEEYNKLLEEQKAKLQTI